MRVGSNPYSSAFAWIHASAVDVFDLGGPRVGRGEPVVRRDERDAAFGEVVGVLDVEALAFMLNRPPWMARIVGNGPSPAGTCTSRI